jgi:hypothetical protein
MLSREPNVSPALTAYPSTGGSVEIRDIFLRDDIGGEDSAAGLRYLYQFVRKLTANESWMISRTSSGVFAYSTASPS